mgnify:CR=1 FL=1
MRGWGGCGAFLHRLKGRATRTLIRVKYRNKADRISDQPYFVDWRFNENSNHVGLLWLI